MTYISNELNQICENFCPMYDMCDRDYECMERKTIKQQIMEIMKNDS